MRQQRTRIRLKRWNFLPISFHKCAKVEKGDDYQRALEPSCDRPCPRCCEFFNEMFATSFFKFYLEQRSRRVADHSVPGWAFFTGEKFYRFRSVAPTTSCESQNLRAITLPVEGEGEGEGVGVGEGLRVHAAAGPTSSSSSSSSTNYSRNSQIRFLLPFTRALKASSTVACLFRSHRG